jgi:hypothetical protein
MPDAPAQHSLPSGHTFDRRRKHLALLLAALCFSCQSLIQPEFSPERLQEGRLGNQVYFEDSADVFFAGFTNAFPDRDLIWFTVLIDGDVTMAVHDAETDTIEAVYHFAEQSLPLHTLACRLDNTRMVKCVLRVDGRKKCARLYPAWDPLPQNWKTRYTVDRPTEH